MKKLLSVIFIAVLTLVLSVSSVSAYIVPAGLGVSYEEGAEFNSLSANDVYGYIGDADFNGKINIRDATLIQKSVANITELSPEGKRLADADFSDSVNIRDATAIQKWIAGVKTTAPVFHALYSTDDEAQVECLLGNWVGNINIAKELNAQINTEGLEGFSLERVEVKFFISFNEDGTYIITSDADSFDTTIKQLKAEYSKALIRYLEVFIEDNKLDTTVEEVLKLSGYNSAEEMVEEIVPVEEIKESLAELYQEGRYKVKNNGIYVSDSFDKEAQIGRNGIYYDYSDAKLVIITANGLFTENMLPAEFARI